MVEGLVQDGTDSLEQILDDDPVLFHLSIPLLQDRLLQLVSTAPVHWQLSASVLELGMNLSDEFSPFIT